MRSIPLCDIIIPHFPSSAKSLLTYENDKKISPILVIFFYYASYYGIAFAFGPTNTHSLKKLNDHHIRSFTEKTHLVPICISRTMAFSATPAFTGIPDFRIIHISPEQTAAAFQAYLDTASKLTGVSLDDINRDVTRLPADLARATLVDLVALGMRLFDAVVWLTAGRPASHPLLVNPLMTRESIPSLHDIAKSVFYVYFMLVVQARYPVGRSEQDKPRIPNFLRTIMGMDQDQHVYVERICTFSPQKFDPAWVRYVQFTGFGQEVLSRFGLGVAGYRAFGPFGLYEIMPGLPQNIQDAATFARTVARAPASWDIHPLTRNPNVLTIRGNLNKNLGNLLLVCFTEAQIAEMVATKMIFKKPDMEPSHRNYMTWPPHDDISGNAKIFG